MTDEERLAEATTKLARLLWAFFVDDEGDEIERYDFLDLAEKAGLVKTVVYDPSIHGEIEDVEPGGYAWVPTELGAMLTGGWLDRLVNGR